MVRVCGVKACLIFVLVAAFLWAACSSDEKPGGDQSAADSVRISVGEPGGQSVEGAPKGDPYEGWLVYSYANFRIHYSEGHPRADLLHEMATAFTALARRDAEFFKIPVPTDTINVYFYTGVGQSRTTTGRIWPYADAANIHFWLPCNYGPIMAQLMVQRWQPVEPKHRFLKHGLILMLEFTGRNHHQEVVRAWEGDSLIPLATLATDTTVSSDYPSLQGSEAASFVDFFAYAYGLDAVRGMYLSTQPFDQAVQGLLSVSVDSLQTLWLNIARQAANLEQVLDTL